MPSVFGGLIKRAFTLADKVQGLGQSPEALQRRTLKRLLRKAQYTAFGKHYEFFEILSAPDIIKAFQEKIPIFDYDKIHDEWWYRSLNNERNVTWRGKVKHFALSSGTTGTPSKFIPMTDDMIRAIQKAGMKAFFASTKFGLGADFYTKKGLLIGGSTSLKNTGGYYVGDMSGINVKKRPLWLQPFVRPTDRISSISDWNRRLDIIARNAPKWDIGYISGIPSWVQLMIEKVVAYNKVKNIHEIWPNLQVFVHGGIAFEPHRTAFDALMTKPMVYIDTYLASEGFIAFQKRPDNIAMSMILNNGIFYEFIPFNDTNFSDEGNLRDKPRVYNIHEVKKDINYALIISTCAGSWRYLIGDTIRFTNTERKEIIITGRTKQFLSVTGEHLSIDNMNQGIQHAQDALKTDVKEFTVAAIETPSGFVHRWYIGCEPLVDTTRFATLLDEKLKEVNDDYATERSAVLLPPQVEAISPTLFLTYLKSKGKFGGQAKFPRVMKKETFAEFEAFVTSAESFF
jgi:GH3 auxin-responsive promoter